MNFNCIQYCFYYLILFDWICPNNTAVFAEFTQASKVVEVIHKGDLLKSLRSLRELQPWNAPVLLTHLYR